MQLSTEIKQQCTIQCQTNKGNDEVKKKNPPHPVPKKRSNWGKWTNFEILRYLTFFEFFLQRNVFVRGRKWKNIFDIMSVFVRTRSSLQCRSKHKMMISKYFSVRFLLKKMKEQFPKEQYSKFYDQKIPELELLQKQFQTPTNDLKRSEEQNQNFVKIQHEIKEQQNQLLYEKQSMKLEQPKEKVQSQSIRKEQPIKQSENAPFQPYCLIYPAQI